MTADARGRVVPGPLGAEIERAIGEHGLDLVSLDPFVKTHGVEENSNSQMDQVVEFLANLAVRQNVAVDVPHHTAKGAADPGNANRGRGASAVKDGGRLVYTLSAMSADEARLFDVPEAERRSYIRMDSGKVNITPPAAGATWFRLVSVPLGNADEAYPGGDNVQAVEPWQPPETWDGLTCDIANRILDDIDAGMPDGERYSGAPSATARAAWPLVQKHAPDKTAGQCRAIVREWIKNGVLVGETYHSPAARKNCEGLRVVPENRPGRASQ